MEDLAEQLVADLEPADGWRRNSSEHKLFEVALAMLEELDPDTVEECFTTIVSVLKGEFDG
jgi:hypothetical protein